MVLPVREARNREPGREVRSMGEEIFEGEPVTAVPSAASEYNRKMPGEQDSNGDQCRE
jgi:hypothetical protein